MEIIIGFLCIFLLIYIIYFISFIPRTILKIHNTLAHYDKHINQKEVSFETSYINFACIILLIATVVLANLGLTNNEVPGLICTIWLIVSILLSLDIIRKLNLISIKTTIPQRIIIFFSSIYGLLIVYDTYYSGSEYKIRKILISLFVILQVVLGCLGMLFAYNLVLG